MTTAHVIHPRRFAHRVADRKTDETARWTALLAQARHAAAAVLRLPPTHPDVEDRAQDAMVAFLASGLPRFDAARGTPEALVGVIARNLALSQLRARARRVRLDDRLLEPVAAAGDAGHRRVEARRDLGRILDRLCPGHVEALVRIDLAGERIGEAAVRTGKSYAAMNGQVGHARAAARRVADELMAA
jgi:DNA-directed RNA polymerase specialized sigma24 family protein